jgi:LEA14-like dessication related protein
MFRTHVVLSASRVFCVAANARQRNLKDLMMQTKRTLCALLMIATLTGCMGARPKVISAPQVLIQSLSQDGQARVVLHNYSNVPMQFSEMRYELKFAGVMAASGALAMDIEVPQDSPESVTLTFVLNPAAKQKLTLNQPIAYTLTGMMTASKPSRRDEFSYQGQLSPIPGKPGEWR